MYSYIYSFRNSISTNKLEKSAYCFSNLLKNLNLAQIFPSQLHCFENLTLLHNHRQCYRLQLLTRFNHLLLKLKEHCIAWNYRRVSFELVSFFHKTQGGSKKEWRINFQNSQIPVLTVSAARIFPRKMLLNSQDLSISCRI